MVVFKGLGQALRFLREQRGKSQKRVAADAGITPPMLSAYENGRTSPEMETLDKILDRGLGATLGELVRALDVVNDRLPAGERQLAAAPGRPWQPPWPGVAEGRPLPPALEEGYAEIVRGLLRISRHVYESVAGAQPLEPDAEK